MSVPGIGFGLGFGLGFGIGLGFGLRIGLSSESRLRVGVGLRLASPFA